jgi:hypothetical protein
VGRVLAEALDDVTGLHEQASGAGCRIEDKAVVGLDDVGDGRHQQRRGEELAVVLRPLYSELHQEVFMRPNTSPPTLLTSRDTFILLARA